MLHDVRDSLEALHMLEIVHLWLVARLQCGEDVLALLIVHFCGTDNRMIHGMPYWVDSSQEVFLQWEVDLKLLSKMQLSEE